MVICFYVCEYAHFCIHTLTQTFVFNLSLCDPPQLLNKRHAIFAAAKQSSKFVPPLLAYLVVPMLLWLIGYFYSHVCKQACSHLIKESEKEK